MPPKHQHCLWWLTDPYHPTELQLCKLPTVWITPVENFCGRFTPCTGCSGSDASLEVPGWGSPRGGLWKTGELVENRVFRRDPDSGARELGRNLADRTGGPAVTKPRRLSGAVVAGQLGGWEAGRLGGWAAAIIYRGLGRRYRRSSGPGSRATRQPAARQPDSQTVRQSGHPATRNTEHCRIGVETFPRVRGFEGQALSALKAVAAASSARTTSRPPACSRPCRGPLGV